MGKSILKWILIVANIAAGLVLLLTLVGSVLSPALIIIPAYFGLWFPLVIAINIAFILFWMLARKWLFLISLSLLLFSVSQINDIFPLHIRKDEAHRAKHSFKILTYNSMMSGKLVKHKKKKPNKVIQYVLDSNADIVCLQEFTSSTKEEYITHQDMLRIFKKYPYKHIDYKLNERSKLFGIATLSKFPIINRKRIKYNSYGNISIYSDMKIFGETIRVINNHLESNRLTDNDKIMPIRLKDNFDANKLSGVTLHFMRKLGATYRIRAKQADAVAKVIANSPYKVLVCGDFNDVPPSYAYTKIKGGLKDAFSETGTGFGWTFNDRYYHFRIDYVMYDSTAFFPMKFKIDKVKYSDHYPVTCKIAIKEKNEIEEIEN